MKLVISIVRMSFLVIAIIFFCVLTPQMASAATTSDGWVYTVKDNKAIITAYMGNESDLIIPHTVSDEQSTYPVSAIGDRAFLSASQLKSLYIPDNIASIGEAAASFCSNLTEISVDSSNLAYSSYDGILYDKSQGVLICYPAGRAGSFNVPSGVSQIGVFAFAGCQGLTEVTIPYGVNNIGYNAFVQCKHLTNINLPNSLNSIGHDAFRECRNLKNMTIPDSVTFIGDSAFTLCRNLTNVSISKNITVIGDMVFDECSSLTDVKLPNGLVSIGKSAFAGCKSLKSIIIPDNLTSIGERAFGESGIEIVIVPGSVVSIGDFAFRGCNNLTKVNISEGVAEIGLWSFDGCTSLKSIDLPASISALGTDPFLGCNGLAAINVAIGNSVYSSLDGVLYDKTKDTLICYPAGKEGSFNVPDGVSVIGPGAFEACSSLTSINIPDTVTSISDRAFKDCTGLRELIIPAGVTIINDETLTGCTRLERVSLPKHLAKIGNEAFRYCSSLTNVIIPDTVEEIATGSFDECTGLKEIIIPKNVRTIGDWAFADCINLSSVTIPEGLVSIGDTAFRHCINLKNITLPGSLTEIGENAFEYCTSLQAINVSRDNAILSSLDGVLYDKKQNYLIYCPAGRIGSVYIPANVKQIWDMAFRGCNSLTEINVSGSNTEYSSLDGILYNKLQDTMICCPAGKAGLLDIPDTVTTPIDKYMLAECQGITAIIVDSGNQAYSSLDGVVYNKSGDTLIYCAAGRKGSLTVPNRVSSISQNAFLGCTGLTSITIPEIMVNIQIAELSNCNSLTAIYVSGGNQAYSSLDGVLYDKALMSLIYYPAGRNGPFTIPNGVNTIGANAFGGCLGLTGITIPSSVTMIDAYAFRFCNNLKNITMYPKTAPDIDPLAFDYMPDNVVLYVYTGAAGYDIFEKPWVRFLKIEYIAS